MALRIFNTLSRRKEPLTTLAPGKVSIYVCGPTVYDAPHLGHARSAVVFDVMVRYLKATGRGVTYVRNITDIDDKIIAAARRNGQDFRTLGARYRHRYQAALEQLNVRPPDIEPKVSDYLAPIQDCVSALVQSGHAYTCSGDVYFSVPSFKPYGRLSGGGVQTTPGAANTPSGPYKRHPADFALWKKAKPDEPSWNSPWGPGRPGWHIECSAMSTLLLGEVFDIHGGGTDLIFPHHDNEIAQSQSLSGKTPANYWVHNGLVHIGSEKMSKSMGNALTLDDLLATYPPDAVRLFLLSKRYRHPIEFSHHGMSSASKRLTRIFRFFSRFGMSAAAPTNMGKTHGALWSRFCRAMDDDFNLPMALSVVFEGIRSINRTMGAASRVQPNKPPDDLRTAIADLFFMCQKILGLKISCHIT